MKSVLDASFKYKPSFDTDVKRTFERIRASQEAARVAAPAVLIPLFPVRKTA